ncbi:hypothetical protein B0A49_08958 [Cryomyces minteri]|uniref:CN hydrolase domain-containing protein n=1 Tax=Cryomyces minteri TaxID=331657 RepID=A0A4U0WSD1_9PEZI|nr:hypothetical protein B0A49_08958 [Cryomyces minteri]
MKVACLQFAPRLGEFAHNVRRADEILDSSQPGRLHYLVLPEMAFSGYKFPSLEAIIPFLEPTAAGPTTQWAQATARRFKCHVTVGYPEITEEHHYNSAVTVSPAGLVIANYRKSFLYYTDMTWADEGDHGFFAGSLGALGNAAMGICMDINPYKFLPGIWENYEFANHCLRVSAPLIVLSMAWLTRLLPRELSIDPQMPDHETLAYWIERFRPLVEAAREDPTILILANRCGVEGDHKTEVAYAGSSCVMCIQGGKVKIYEMLGKGEEKLLIVNTADKPKYAVTQ